MEMTLAAVEVEGTLSILTTVPPVSGVSTATIVPADGASAFFLPLSGLP